jgi:hypothetical protein
LPAIRRHGWRQRLDVRRLLHWRLLHWVELVHWDLVHRHWRRHWTARLQASRMHWARWHEARRVHRSRLLHWAGVLERHGSWLHALLVQLKIGPELEVEAALAAVLAGVALPRGGRLLDRDVVDVHVARLRGSLRPVVGVLAHRVAWRKSIKSEGVLPGRRETKTKDIIITQTSTRDVGGGARGFDGGKITREIRVGQVVERYEKLLTTDHSRASSRRILELAAARGAILSDANSRAGWPGRRRGWGRERPAK